MATANKFEKLGTDPVFSLLLRLSLPAIFAMAIQALYNVVDSIYVGHVSGDALTALSVAFPIQMVLIAISVGTGIGASAVIARFLGQKSLQKASQVAEHATVIIIFYGIIIGLIGALFSKQLIKLFIEDQTIIKLGYQYIRIILVGSFLTFFPIIGNSILRGQGNTVLPMISMLIGAILNILIDPFFIFGEFNVLNIHFKGLALGVSGAAFATVLAQFISATFIFFMLFSKKNEVKINLKDFKFDFGIIKNIYKIGFPAMIMQLLASFMVASINKILAGYTPAAVAVVGVYFRLQSFIFMPVFGLNDGGFMPIMSYNYGNRNAHRMKEVFFYTLLISTLFTTAGLILFQTIPEELIRLFNDSEEIVQIGTGALKNISVAFPIVGPAIIISTAFQALGEGFKSLLLSFLRQIIILLPILYYLVNEYGIDACWYAFPISDFISFGLSAVWIFFYLKEVFKKFERRAEIK